MIRNVNDDNSNRIVIENGQQGQSMSLEYSVKTFSPQKMNQILKLNERKYINQ